MRTPIPRNVRIAGTLLVVGWSAIAQAQESKPYASQGVVEVGGGASITSTSSEDGGDSTGIIALAPSVGAFVADGFELWGGLQLVFLSEGDFDSSTQEIRFGPAYYGGSGQVFLGVRGSLGYAASQASLGDMDADTGGPMLYGAFALRAPVAPGGLLDIGLGAAYWLRGDDPNMLTFGLEAGFLVFF